MKTYLTSVRGAVRLLLLVAAVSWSNAAYAAGGKTAGAPLLRAQLPHGTTIQQADCAVLSRAVTRATLDHKTDAPAILSAALTNGSADETLRKEEKRSCECVTHLVRASVKAAPSQASDVVDVATALYPECADSLASILTQAKKDLAAYDYKDARDYKGSNQPVAGIISQGGTPGATAFGGLGPGFPGSPGFGGSDPSSGLGGTTFNGGSPGSPGSAGSDPSGGTSLPAPSGSVAITPVVNQ